jgi:hypothetical protein
MATLHSDSFTGANGTNLATHNANYNVFYGDFEIQGNMAYANGLSRCMYLDTGSFPADYQLTVTKQAYTGQHTILYIRSTVNNANTNCYRAYWEFSNGNIILERVVSGSSTTIGSSYLSANSIHTFTIKAVGSTISVLVDGVSKISVTDTQYANHGYCGFQCGSGISVDDLLIESIVTATAIKDLISMGIIAFPR